MSTSFIADLDMKTVERNLITLGSKFPKAVRERALPQIGHLVLAEAQPEEVAPIKTGFLVEDSAFVRPSASFVEIGFGADYAQAVHETHPTKRRWFLRAIVQHAPRIIAGVLKKTHDDMEKEMRP